MSEPVAATSRPALRRVLGFRDVALFFVVAIVGLRWLSTAAAAGPSSLVVWAIAFVGLFLPLGFAVVELSARHPEEGGLYVWTRAAFGEFWGFIAAWMYWVSNLVYLPALLYFAAANAVFLAGPSWRGLAAAPAYPALVAVGGIALGIGLNAVGLDVGKRLHNLGAWGMWVPVALLIGLAAAGLATHGSATRFSPSTLLPDTRLSDVYFWSTIAFAYGGFEAASFMGEEIRDARRTVPRAVVVAGLLIAALYVLGTAAILVAIPSSEVDPAQGLLQAVQRLADRLNTPWAPPLCAALVVVGALGGAGAWLAATARLMYVGGVERYLPPVFGRLHPKWGTPVWALVGQGAGACAFAIIGQAGASVRAAYDFLVSMGVITYFVPFVLLFASWARLRGWPAESSGPSTPGGRPVALLLATLGLVTTAVSIALAVFPPGEEGAATARKIALATFLVLALGVAIYVRGRRRPRAA